MDCVKLEAARRSKPFGWSDLIVFAAAIALTVLVVWGAYRRKGASVEIVAPGFSAVYPLDADRTVELETLTVVIEGGSVYVTAPDCPDKVCEHTGRIRHENQSIVCLPNRVTVTIRADGAINGSTGQK